MSQEREYLTISKLNGYIKEKFNQDTLLRQVYLVGELSNVKEHKASGHWYFTLKDENASISAVMFKAQATKLDFKPENGLAIRLRGRVAVYEKTGTYQVYVEIMKPLGEGTLLQRFEALKKKLAQEGVFKKESARRNLKPYPKTIAIVTSPTGAVIRDMVLTLRRRAPQVSIILIPANVQGLLGVESITQALDQAYALDNIDAIIVGRGGGSIEDLWAFNEEAVVRKIALSPVPIISAVGHETDTTLSDYAADWRAGTPSIAAEMVARDNKATLAELSTKKAQIAQLIKNIFTNKKMLLHSHLKHSLLLAPERFLDSYKLNLDTKVTKLEESLTNYLKKCQEDYERRVASLVGLNPLAVLNRGYTYVKKDEVVVKSVKDLVLKDSLSLCFVDGTVKARIEEIEENKNG